MRCPYCGNDDTRVLESRQAQDGRAIRRRRECTRCQERFTTFETVEMAPLVVIKKSGTREPFQSDKIVRGLMRACEKRPVSLETMQAIAEDIEREARGAGLREITSTQIGEAVLRRLIDVDQVAYVRFASVYREFDDVNGFLQELRRLEGLRLEADRGT
ncbi:MAG: transcriptional repressor NrdR [Hydrogenibacillus sp.]|nr:transcriptional repressor NrdR [Hydrogenibacillus sp.]